MRASASATVSSGRSVTGSTIIPASERFTLSTSATCSATERLRWTTPMPPSRASAIAILASVTVSIAAETIGTASEISRVRRVRVEASAGSTLDSAGRSSRSSNVSPSFANFCSSARSRSISARPSSSSIAEVYRRGPTTPPARPLPLVGDGLEPLDLHERRQTARLTGVEASSTGLEDRGRTCPDCSPDGVLGAPATLARGEVPSEQDIARSDGRHGLESRGDRAQPHRLAILMREGVATVLDGQEDVPGAELGDLVEAVGELVIVGELVADESLRLGHVRRDELRLRLDREAERLAVGVDDHGEPTAEVADELRVEAVVDRARQRPGEHEHGRTLRQVVELPPEHLELLGRHLRSPLVDLRVGVRDRVEDCERGPRLARDADEVVQDPLPGQVLEDLCPVRPPGQAGADNGHAETLERAGDVDPLAARAREPVARAVAVADAEVGDRQRPVHRGVERDRDNHPKIPVSIPPASSRARPAYQPTFRPKLSSSTLRAATSGTGASTRPPCVTRTDPRRAPSVTGAETEAGATTFSTSGRSTRTTARIGRAATSRSFSSSKGTDAEA